jgi:hypothetical protein
MRYAQPDPEVVNCDDREDHKNEIDCQKIIDGICEWHHGSQPGYKNTCVKRERYGIDGFIALEIRINFQVFIGIKKKGKIMIEVRLDSGIK